MGFEWLIRFDGTVGKAAWFVKCGFEFDDAKKPGVSVHSGPKFEGFELSALNRNPLHALP